MNRLALKFMALGLSLILWFYVLSTESLNVSKEIQVNYIFSDKYSLVEKVPTSVEVYLKGPRAFLRSLIKKPLKLELDIQQAVKKKKGEYIFNLKTSNFNLPLGVEVERIVPQTIIVKLDQKVRKKIRVRPRYTGEVNEDHKIFKQELRPRRIEIEGARKNLDKIKFLWTKDIDVSELLGEGEKRVQLDFPYPHIRKSSAEDLSYSYRIIPAKANLVLDNVKIQFLSSFKILESSHRFATLSVYSSGKDEKTIRSEGLQLEAYIPDGESGWVEVKLEAQVPNGVHVLKIFPDKIKVLIQ